MVIYFIMKMFIASIILPFFFFSKINAQHQERQVIIYNIALGGITTGIGAAINKQKSEKVFPAFFRGFKSGCIGGAFLYGGKKMSYLINKQDNLIWGWPSKLVHSYGASIMENAAKNDKNPFSKLSFPVGFLRFNFSFDEKIKTNVQLQPGSLACFIVNASYWKFKPKESLLIGTPVFTSNSNYILNKGGGWAIINTFTYSELFNNEKYKVIAHEHIHILQEREYLVINNWFNKPKNKIVNNMNPISKKILDHIYLDIPYNYFFYTLMKQKQNCYYKNYFEFEAERFATNKYVQKCY